MSELYIISGCNGAGKTTASYTVLPEMLNCKEFVNADSIAAGLSPFDPDSVALEAGRIMLHRINEMISARHTFALETTLSTRSYVSLVRRAQANNYKITLVYFWLNSPELAKQRVAARVSNGGHNIPEEVIVRRYFRGISNLLKLYIPICDGWMVVNNSIGSMEIIANGEKEVVQEVKNTEIWNIIAKQAEINETGKH